MTGEDQLIEGYFQDLWRCKLISVLVENRMGWILSSLGPQRYTLFRFNILREFIDNKFLRAVTTALSNKT